MTIQGLGDCHQNEDVGHHSTTSNSASTRRIMFHDSFNLDNKTRHNTCSTHDNSSKVTTDLRRRSKNHFYNNNNVQYMMMVMILAFLQLQLFLSSLIFVDGFSIFANTSPNINTCTNRYTFGSTKNIYSIYYAIDRNSKNIKNRKNSKSSHRIKGHLHQLYSSTIDENDYVDVEEATSASSDATVSDVEADDYDNTPPNTAYTSSSSTTNIDLNLGKWEELNGNYLLRPPSTSPYTSEPRALIHFLGGAIVGAAPDITYRYILEKLANNGFLVVSTPYTLSFDHISTCDDIITRFERIAPSLAQQYGPIPVIGVGHSCGSLLHLLITTLFPDTPRAANVLISYNNKGVKEAVPFFDELVRPIFISLGQRYNITDGNDINNDSSDSESSSYSYQQTTTSSTEILNLSIELGRNVIQGNIPSDQAITNILKKTTPRPLQQIIPKDAQIKIPTMVRKSIEDAIDPIVKANVEAGISPLLDQSLDILEQIPSLIQEVADGARDFNPKPESVRAAARRAYRARRTLIIQYDDDPLDESEEIESLLKEAETVMKNKRPMVGFDVQRVMLKGGHATPCLAPPLDLANKVEDLVGEDLAKNKLLYKGADETVDEVVKWLEGGNL